MNKNMKHSGKTALPPKGEAPQKTHFAKMKCWATTAARVDSGLKYKVNKQCGTGGIEPRVQAPGEANTIDYVDPPKTIAAFKQNAGAKKSLNTSKHPAPLVDISECYAHTAPTTTFDTYYNRVPLSRSKTPIISYEDNESDIMVPMYENLDDLLHQLEMIQSEILNIYSSDTTLNLQEPQKAFKLMMMVTNNELKLVAKPDDLSSLPIELSFEAINDFQSKLQKTVQHGLQVIFYSLRGMRYLYTNMPSNLEMEWDQKIRSIQDEYFANVSKKLQAACTADVRSFSDKSIKKLQKELKDLNANFASQIQFEKDTLLKDYANNVEDDENPDLKASRLLKEQFLLLEAEQYEIEQRINDEREEKQQLAQQLAEYMLKYKKLEDKYSHSVGILKKIQKENSQKDLEIQDLKERLVESVQYLENVCNAEDGETFASLKRENLLLKSENAVIREEIHYSKQLAVENQNNTNNMFGTTQGNAQVINLQEKLEEYKYALDGAHAQIKTFQDEIKKNQKLLERRAELIDLLQQKLDESELAQGRAPVGKLNNDAQKLSTWMARCQKSDKLLEMTKSELKRAAMLNSQMESKTDGMKQALTKLSVKYSYCIKAVESMHKCA